jgi:hypothetical protein
MLDYKKIKYMHVEKFGSDEVAGIEKQKSYIFPKIDGTNGVIWYDENKIHCGSRKRELSLNSDNAGFYKQYHNDARFAELFTRHPDWIVYGEFLVKHVIKNYLDDAWRKFYVFDVFDRGENRYIPYNEYIDVLEQLDIDYIPCLAIEQYYTLDDLKRISEQATWLMKDDVPGEGIVIHAYDFTNQYGRTVFAKLVRAEYKISKRIGHKKMDSSTSYSIEKAFIEKYCTEVFIRKEFAKLNMQTGGWCNKNIPRLFNTIFHELVVECTWNFVKNNNMPVINFRVLRYLCQEKIKSTLSDFFSIEQDFL